MQFKCVQERKNGEKTDVPAIKVVCDLLISNGQEIEEAGTVCRYKSFKPAS